MQMIRSVNGKINSIARKSTCRSQFGVADGIKSAYEKMIGSELE